MPDRREDEIHGAMQRAAGRRALVVVLTLFTLWAGWFVYRSSVVVGGERVFCLFDDAMISMTYARNLTEGHGLTWAREGPPTEGFTTPSWTFAMVPVNLLPIPLGRRSLVMQGFSWLLLLANLVAVGWLTRRYFSVGARGAWLSAVVLAASFYPLTYWALMGMETGLMALLATASVLLAYEIVERREDRVVALFAILALGYLTRMDMALLAGVVLGYVVAHRGLRRENLRSWLAGGGLLCAAAIGYQLFRVVTFGAPLPTTYYLKLTGVPLEVRLLRGLSTYADFLAANSVALGVLALAIVPFLRSRRAFRLPVALFLVYSLYSVYVGGDSWEMHNNVRTNRFLAFVVPLLFAAGVGGLNEWVGHFRERVRAGGRAFGVLRSTLVLTFTGLVLVAINGLWGSQRAAENRQNLLVLTPPLLVTSHAVVLTRLAEFREIVRPRARVATFWAGIPAYFSNYRMVDMFGYTDPVISRRPSSIPLAAGNFERYTPGHVKWDYPFVLETRRPDAFFQAWNLTDEQQAALLGTRGFVKRGEFWVRPELLKKRRPPAGG